MIESCHRLEDALEDALPEEDELLEGEPPEDALPEEDELLEGEPPEDALPEEDELLEGEPPEDEPPEDELGDGDGDFLLVFIILTLSSGQKMNTKDQQSNY